MRRRDDDRRPGRFRQRRRSGGHAIGGPRAGMPEPVDKARDAGTLHADRQPCAVIERAVDHILRDGRIVDRLPVEQHVPFITRRTEPGRCRRSGNGAGIGLNTQIVEDQFMRPTIVRASLRQHDRTQPRRIEAVDRRRLETRERDRDPCPCLRRDRAGERRQGERGGGVVRSLRQVDRRDLRQVARGDTLVAPRPGV